MKTKHTFALVTLGCKVNQYEAQALREAWITCGQEESRDTAKADTICLSTCAVTAKAVADARAIIRRTHRENPNASIIVTGCAAQVLEKEFATLPGVTLVVPQADKALLLHPNKTPAPVKSAPLPLMDNEGKPPFPPFNINGYDRSRAVLKVQDGCSHRCTYCIVPLTRGPSRSREPHETLAEAERLLHAGFREIILNGINLSQYGKDFVEKHDFWDLVALLEKKFAREWQGKARIRLSSLEPAQLGKKALDVLGSSVLIAPHLHVSLQSGSKKVLHQMGRGHYTPDVLHEFCTSLRKTFPQFGLGADILSGFPGESETDALETETFCAALPFTYAHVFPYSRRPGTPAYSWPNQVPQEVKKERAARLRTLFAAKKEAFLQVCLDLPEVHVALEGGEHADSAPLSGINEFYADCVFATEAAPDITCHRSLVAAKPLASANGCLVVAALPPSEESGKNTC